MSERAKVTAKTPEAKRENSDSHTKKTNFSQSKNSPIDQILFLQRTVGNHAVERLLKSGVIQAKLTIGPPGDIYEQEADRVADEVMRMPGPGTTERKGVSEYKEVPSVQRICTECEDELQSQPTEEEEELLQTKGVSGETPEVTPSVESQISSIRGGGQSLPESMRIFFEPLFGQDFSQVRVHVDAKAAESAQAVNAQAYTVGNDIVFGTGRYEPGTTDGKRLLAHELTHVVQQQSNKKSQKVQKQTDLFIRRSPGPLEDLQKKYKITIEKGDKDWLESDVKDLQWALSRLSKEEAKVLEGYKFLRWSTREARAKVDKSYQDPGVDECGLQEADFASKTFKISMYDKCFGDVEATSETMAGVPIARYNILHEIGHAMEIAELRKSWEVYSKTTDKYNAASASEQKNMKNALDEAKNKYETSKVRTITEFKKLVEGKEALTEYSKTNAQEAFAEAFALYKANPAAIKKINRKLYGWFEKHGHLNPLKKP